VVRSIVNFGSFSDELQKIAAMRYSSKPAISFRKVGLKGIWEALTKGDPITKKKGVSRMMGGAGFGG